MCIRDRSYGVMVAQQVLVLFVVVRIRLGQRFKETLRGLFFVYTSMSNPDKGKIVVVRIRLGQLEKPRSSKGGAFSLLSQRKNCISVQLPFGPFDEKKGFFLLYKRKIMYLCIRIPCL